MGNVISELLKRVHQLSEAQAEKAVTAIDLIIAQDDRDDSKVTSCPHCGGADLVKNGVKSGKQRHKCKRCGVSFVYTTNTSIQKSRYGEAVWKQVISDTIEGVSLEKTAEEIGFSHTTAFNFRHKILSALEEYEKQTPTVLQGVCEIDDTYVLESYKGTKLEEGFWRKPRKHGAVAEKRGISNEYVSVQAGVERSGSIFTKTVNRATPGSKDVKEAFEGHIAGETLVLCDGAKSYGALKDICEVHSIVQNESGDFSHINNVNGYHSFIKQRYNEYRGVATKYLNRYNALFSRAYGAVKSTVNAVYNILCSENPELYRKVDDLKTVGVLDI